MTPERWKRVERIYHSAVELEPGGREKFLTEACQGDDELRREIESLLAQAGTGGWLDSPAWERAASILADSTVTQLAIGAQLGPYRILSPLGSGGMGRVYKAVDTRLDRAVAIKMSEESLKGRFEREARAISALNHAHICTLYDVGPNYLVMELVEGETLAARLRQGTLSIDQVLQYGAQIADALAAAHAQGIIHRDLKPGNIMVTKTGVKVLDFGLAKLTRSADALPKQAATSTASQAIIGTLAYMAPEQLEGKECDARTDIFALGLVLCEMATRKRVMQGDSQAALIAEIMRFEPVLPQGIPEKLAHVIERCLARDPENRWQSARDVNAELEWARKSPSATSPIVEKRGEDLRPNQPASPITPARKSVHPRRILLGAALSAAAGAVGISAWRELRGFWPAAELPLRKFSLTPDYLSDDYFAENPRAAAAISPDGRQIAYVAALSGQS